MEAARMAALLVAAALMCAALRSQRPEMAMALSVTAGAVTLGWALNLLAPALSALTDLSREAALPEETGRTLMKAAGVTLLTDWGAQLCRDAGESALAGRVELGGRAALLAMSVPLLTGLFDLLRGMLP